MNAPLIEIKSLRAAYDGKTVLHDVNLTVYDRDFLGIIGPNGGGKTTLIKCILGLLKPAGGTIAYHSCRPGGADGKLAMGYLPQYTAIDRKFPITVEEVVLSGLAGRKPLTARFTGAEREKAAQVMTRMGLDGLGHRPIGTLSGGQLQRALLGRAVISDPEVVILDEPSTYIDRRFEARLYELLSPSNCWDTGCYLIAYWDCTNTISGRSTTRRTSVHCLRRRNTGRICLSVRCWSAPSALSSHRRQS